MVLVRHGTAIDPAPNASEPDTLAKWSIREYAETWMEGMDVDHTPRALHPLDPEMLPGAVHHVCWNTATWSRWRISGSRWRSLSSILAMRDGKAAQEQSEQVGDA